MTDGVAIGIGAVVGGAAAVLASTTGGYYHDAIRPFARDLRSGSTDARQLAQYAWGVSWRFVVYFAAPFCVLSGAVVSALVLLPAEVVAVRVARTWLGGLIGALIGAAGLALTLLAHDAIVELDLGRDLIRLIEPVLWLYPAVPLVAAAKVSRAPAGVACVGGLEAVTAAILHFSGADEAVAPAATLAGVIALFLFQVPGSPRQPTAPLHAGESTSYIRRALPLLVVVGAGVGMLAGSARLAGDPLAAVLLADDAMVDAAAVALLTFIAFWPLVAASSVAADSYASQGTPDLIPAAGYLATGLGPLGAAAAGVVAMTGEVVARRRSMRLVMERPRLSDLASAIRDALGDITLLAMLIGGLSLASVAGPLAFLAVGLAWLLNEQAGAPVMRFAVAPTAALVALLGAELWGAIS